ncbi:hypothetical protein [Thaumasiovibrio subtropicus]|uniref:hypothetical protein n=1 Tax=Thaumasiovibrio subtropicus TaxID=1891207 RepID=UPI000B356032|nr:hypothetical protein [Thaumasiovibrio subtropicus]
MSDVTIVGGWTQYRPLTPEDHAVFDTALKGFVGVNYQPTEVSSQVVAGINYRYKCNASLPGPEIMEWEAVVEIFKPLEGQPHITNIHKI